MGAARVAIVRCEVYDEPVVLDAVGRALDLVGGAGGFVRPGERIVLKPNFLAPSSAESAVVTHPSVFRAVAHHLREAGALLSYGDSPGVPVSANIVARRSGVGRAARQEGVELVEFGSGRTVSFPEGNLIKQFDIAEAVLDADGLVTLPKMKTHGLSRMTGAVKNQLGCVPGFQKGEWHARMPDETRFAEMLVDLNRLLEPRLVVMDAVVAMEGNGPRGGDPRGVGAIIVSADPVGVDATVCRLMNLDWDLVDTVRIGEEWGLGSAREIEYVGDPVETFVVRDFKVNRTRGSTRGEPGRFSRFMKRWVVAKPVIREDRCTVCGTCVEVCPVDPKAVEIPSDPRGEHPPVYDYDACIRCFCCQELCPERAIGIEKPLLGRMLER
jgi:uncharacterized protein (DUF362 family)/NAD-dependent dihydropyrimidine dehydrogenase PreA subunit